MVRLSRVCVPNAFNGVTSVYKSVNHLFVADETAVRMIPSENAVDVLNATWPLTRCFAVLLPVTGQLKGCPEEG